jgi:integrase
MPSIGSDQEREAFFVGVQVIVTNHPLSPGIKARGVRQRIADLGQQAAEQSRDAAKRELNIEQAKSLKKLAQYLDDVSPHMLRHSLARRMLKSGVQLPEHTKDPGA